jgi:hypothetical protein
MENASKQAAEQVRAVEPRQDGGKCVIRGVMTHDRVLKMIEERNPIIAQRQTRRD